MDLDLDNPEFSLAYQTVVQTNSCVFLTGKAGTGKSTFLRYVQRSSSKKIVVLAPTGIAAVNVSGVTIHSFFQFPLGPIHPDGENVKSFGKKAAKRKLITKVDTIIIDEISMVRADLIDGIDISLRKNGGDPNLPFGGKQMIFIGDIFQLEPVIRKDSEEYEILKQFYKSFFFFDAQAFQNIALISIELQKVYRQKEVSFIRLLDKVRKNNVNSVDIAQLNQRYQKGSQDFDAEGEITLCTTNRLADEKNETELDELVSKQFTFTGKVQGTFEESKYPAEFHLALKEEAQVMFIKNDIQRGRWANGTMGKITFLSQNTIEVELKNGEKHEVETEEWENRKYSIQSAGKGIDNEIIGTYTQYPLKLAWAVTIHKSQGLTFDKVFLNLGRGAFASGQLYVALSRCRTFEGIVLFQKITRRDIFVHQKLIEFSKKFQTKYQIQNSMQKLEKELYEQAKKAYEKKDFQDALKHFEKAIEINPKNAVLHTFLGRTCQELEEYQTAILAYQKAIELCQSEYNAETAFKLSQKIVQAQQEIIQKLIG